MLDPGAALSYIRVSAPPLGPDSPLLVPPLLGHLHQEKRWSALFASSQQKRRRLGATAHGLFDDLRNSVESESHV